MPGQAGNVSIKLRLDNWVYYMIFYVIGVDGWRDARA
jgi:hypothetical protein